LTPSPTGSLQEFVDDFSARRLFRRLLNPTMVLAKENPQDQNAQIFKTPIHEAVSFNDSYTDTHK
jgi:hypothetical protein